MEPFEQRVFSRLSLGDEPSFIDVQLFNWNSPNSPITPISINNVSPTGVSLRIHKDDLFQIDLNKSLTLEIEGIDDFPVRCRAEVKRLDENMDTVDIGMQFQRLPLYLRDKIKKDIEYTLLNRQYKSVKTSEETEQYDYLAPYFYTATVSGIFGLVYGLINKMAPDLEPLLNLFK